MKHLSILAILAALATFAPLAIAAEQFPDQPNVQRAYDHLVGVLSHLEKAKLEHPDKQVKDAIVGLSNASTYLQQATNNKGTYLKTAKDLCDQAKTALEANSPDIDKATEAANRALHEVNMAGKAGRRHH